MVAKVYVELFNVTSNNGTATTCVHRGVITKWFQVLLYREADSTRSHSQLYTYSSWILLKGMPYSSLSQLLGKRTQCDLCDPTKLPLQYVHYCAYHMTHTMVSFMVCQHNTAKT